MKKEKKTTELDRVLATREGLVAMFVEKNRAMVKAGHDPRQRRPRRTRA